MNSHMMEALKLTGRGKLKEATQLIQSMLSKNTSPVIASELISSDIDMIDVTPRQYANETANQPTPSSEYPHADITSSFVEKTYTGSSGTLNYWLYKPIGSCQGKPLVIMLHGCTQSPQDFALGTHMNALADEMGFVVAYPAQTQAANPQKCWNWFRPGDQIRDQGEPALLAGITRQILTEELVDTTRVYIAGLSAGGAAAATMAALYPDLFAAVGIHSGLDFNVASDLPSAFAAMKNGSPSRSTNARRFVPIVTFHGDKDATVHEANSRAIVKAATKAKNTSLHTTSSTGKTSGGVAYTLTAMADDYGKRQIEQWTIHKGGHAWSGGNAAGSYTEPNGPDASREMIRFFLTHHLD